jgi:hypothetical protein
MLASCGKAEEDEIEPVGAAGHELVEHEVGIPRGQAGVQRGRARTCLRVAGGEHHLEVGVLRAEPQQLGAGVPGCADDADSNHDA